MSYIGPKRPINLPFGMTSDQLSEGWQNLYYTEERVNAVVDGRVSGPDADLATAAQGDKADTALQAEDVGTAATADVQDYPADTTVGALLKVGAFGWGGDAVTPPAGDANNITVSGAYLCTDSTLNAPESYGTILHIQRGGSSATQVFMTSGSNPSFYSRRCSNNSLWDDWIAHLNTTHVQSSPTDSTEDLLMKVGAFGLGSSVVYDNDLNLLVNSGFYYAFSNSTNRPAEANNGYVLVVDNGQAGYLAQTYIPYNQDRLWVRRMDGNVWYDWKELLTEGAVQSSPTDTTAGALTKVGAFGLGVTFIESGLDLNDNPPGFGVSCSSSWLNAPSWLSSDRGWLAHFGASGTGNSPQLLFQLGGTKTIGYRGDTSEEFSLIAFQGEAMQLGESSPAIKMKKITGTTGSAEGSSTSVAHGIDASKIIGIQALIRKTSTSGNVANDTVGGEQNFTVAFSSSTITVALNSTDSSELVNLPFTVLITYEE